MEGGARWTELLLIGQSSLSLLESANHSPEKLPLLRHKHFKPLAFLHFLYHFASCLECFSPALTCDVIPLRV